MSELADAVSAEIEERVAAALREVRAGAGRHDGRRSGRSCPVPGCGNPGAGPRNRWFCREHAASLSLPEQKSILERNRRLAAEDKAAGRAAKAGAQVQRLPARQKREHGPLDMSCRVEGCTNRSRGPRAGFICDQHRAELSPEEQKQARERWNARRKAAAAEAPRPAPLAPVPPIVRKAEPSA